MENNHCPICNHATVFTWEATPFNTCTTCGLRIRRLEDQGKKMEQLYNASWQAPDQFVGETGATDNRLAKIYLENLAKELGFASLKGLKILDFGAGKGEVLEALQEMGAVAYGVEPFGYDLLIQKGFHAFKSIEDALPHGPFDGIVSIDVLEHLIDPVSDVRSLNAALKNHGWFYAATPNNGSLRARLTGQRWEEALRKGHLFLFSAKSVRRLFEKAGFTRIQRLNWVIPYHNQLPKRLLNSILTIFRLDGELRFLGFKS